MLTQLRIADITVAIECDDPRLSCGRPASADGPMAMFLDQGAVPDFRITAEVLQQYEPPDGRTLFDSNAVWTLHEDGRDLRIEFRSPIFGDEPYKIAIIDREFTSARIQMKVVGDANPLEFPFDELLFNALLTRRGGLELHACGLIEEGQGLVFCGNSGDGKTTTAGLWKGARRPPSSIVSDDRVIVRPQDGVWRMYGTPWHGEAQICSTESAALAAIFTLDKANSNRIARMSPAGAAARLLACAFPPFHDPKGLNDVIEIAAAVSEAVPVARFTFRNDESSVDTVRRELPALLTEHANALSAGVR